MRNLKAAVLITLSLALNSPVRAALVLPDLAALQRAALRGSQAPRPAALADAPRLSAAEREALASAQLAAPSLGELRGGHDVTLTDHDLKVIGITLLAIIALVIII